MSVTNGIVSRLGQINKAGDANSLFLTQFGGEILVEFEKTCVFKDRHLTRQITNGRSAQFPMIGSTTSSYHVPGDWIDGNQIGHAQVTLTIDGLLISPIFIAQMDELENHYDVRGPYATELGRELARQYDVNVAQTMVLAARQSSSPLTGRSGGTKLVNATVGTSSAVLISQLYKAAETLDVKNVASADRSAFLRPAQYYLLVQDTTLLNKFYSGSADISKGIVDTAAGMTLVKTNHLPSTDLSADSATPTQYRGNYAATVALVANKYAAGTLQLMDLAMESEWEVRRQGTFMLAKMAVGHGILRSDCAVELASA